MLITILASKKESYGNKNSFILHKTYVISFTWATFKYLEIG